MPEGHKDGVPSVGVIVLNWNGTDDTLECLRSLAAVHYPRYEVILVDNGSDPSPRERIEADFPGVVYVETGTNFGYAGGNNIGMRTAMARGHDYVFVLNNDTVVEPEFLQNAVATAETDAHIGVVGIKIVAWEQPDRVWVAYGEVTYGQGLVRLIGYYSLDNGDFDEQKDVEWVPGTAMLFRRQALEVVGLFDEEFFAYHEDVDWCTAARAKGFRVVFAPSARIYHKGHRSSGGRGYVTPRQYLAGHNMVLFVLKHAPWYQALRFLLVSFILLPLQYVRRYFRGEQRGVVLKARGMVDALRGRPIPLAELGLQ